MYFKIGYKMRVWNEGMKQKVVERLSKDVAKASYL
jgi:hypothetical protein